MTLRVKIIGLGGIGSYIVDPLVRYLNFQHQDIQVTLVDGDTYEDKNRARQQFQHLVNKASDTAERLTPRFPKVQFRVKREYVTEDNVMMIVREGDLVFLCVDNHATRKLISDRCQELDNVVLISGGNDYTDGNVIYYCRKDGQDLTPSLTDLDSTIANPQDKNPGEQETREGCYEEAESTPQLVFANNAIASRMCCVYYAHEKGKANFHQVYDDILTQTARPSPED